MLAATRLSGDEFVAEVGRMCGYSPGTVERVLDCYWKNVYHALEREPVVRVFGTTIKLMLVVGNMECDWAWKMRNRQVPMVAILNRRGMMKNYRLRVGKAMTARWRKMMAQGHQFVELD